MNYAKENLIILENFGLIILQKFEYLETNNYFNRMENEEF